jgi:HupE / UreJ protein
VGLPQHAIPVALLFFNLGVEIGQLAFVTAVLTTDGLFRTAMAFLLKPTLIQRAINRLDIVAAYAIGTVAAFWLIERTSTFFV